MDKASNRGEAVYSKQVIIDLETPRADIEKVQGAGGSPPAPYESERRQLDGTPPSPTPRANPTPEPKGSPPATPAAPVSPAPTSIPPAPVDTGVPTIPDISPTGPIVQPIGK